MISIKSAASVTRKLFSGLAAVVLILGLATSAQAQQSGGSIRGTVAGADSSTVVEVRDDNRGTTKSKSTSDGSFRFDGLSTGSYEVRVLQGGNMVDSTTVTVSLGSATTVAMATTVEAIEEIVTTGTRVAALDTSIAESGLVITADALLEMPVQRDMAAVALLAPGTSRGDYRFGTSGNVAFAGASIAENTSFINGLNTTNFRTGVGFTKVPFEFYETMQVKTGGYSAKYGRSIGGVMNAKSKSGSNDWNFGANVYYESEINQAPETYIGANKLDKDDETTIDAYVSGPIIKDRLFFYALYSDNNQDNRYAGFRSNDYDSTIEEGFWGVKLDAYITDNHHIEYTHFTDENEELEDAYVFDAVAQTRGAYIGPTLYTTGGENWIATYTGDLTDNLQLSISYGENEYARSTGTPTGNIPYVNLYTLAGGFVQQNSGATAFNIIEGLDTREMTRVDINWVIGNHDISFGIDNEENSAIDDTINSGGVYYVLDPNNELYPGGCESEGAVCPDGVVRIRDYSVGGSFTTSSDAYYIQDVWEVNDNWTFELGLRNDTFENLNGEDAVFVKVEDQWAPRLSAVFDPKGDGQSKFFANWGLYYLPVAANTNIRMSGGETYIHDWHVWDGTTTANFIPTGVGARFAQDVFGDGSTPDTRATTDINMDAMYQSELILGYATTLDSGNEIGIKGIYRNLEKTIEDIAIDAGVINYYNDSGTWNPALVDGDTVEDVFGGFHQYILTNPGVAATAYITEMDEYITISQEQLTYPKAERQYAAAEFTFARPFDGQWGANVSYTWSHNWGNHEGYVKSDNAQDDAGITQNFDQPGLTDNAKGNLPNDRRHTIKAWGTYEFNSGLRVGGNALWQSGRPLSCFGLHPTDEFAQAYGDSDSHFCDGEPVMRGSLGTTPDILTVNANVQYTMDMGSANVLLSLDMFNVFDSANAISYNENGDLGDYGKIRRFQEPRTIRLAARMSF